MRLCCTVLVLRHYPKMYTILLINTTPNPGNTLIRCFLFLYFSNTCSTSLHFLLPYLGSLIHLLGGPQFRFPPVFFGIERTNGLKFHVTCCFDSQESKSLVTTPPPPMAMHPPPPLHTLSPRRAEESIYLSTLEHAASPGECSNVGQFFYFALPAAQHRANHNAR